MEKKTYIAPEMEIMNFETEILMQAGSVSISNNPSDGIREGIKFRDGGDDFWW